MFIGKLIECCEGKLSVPRATPPTRSILAAYLIVRRQV